MDTIVPTVRDLLSRAMRDAIAQYERGGGLDRIDMQLGLTSALKTIEVAIADAMGEPAPPALSQLERQALAVTMVTSGTVANLVLLAHLIGAFLCESNRPIMEQLPRPQSPPGRLA